MYNLRKLFFQIRKETNNFKIINTDVLKRTPGSILILRLICGLTHLKLTEIYKKKFDKIVRFNIYENKREKIGNKIGERLSEIFLENIPKEIKLDDIEKKYLQMQTYVKNRYGSENELEVMVKKMLIQNKILFKCNVSIKGKSSVPIDVDFTIPSSLNPKFVIECKTSKGFSGHDSFSKARIMSINAVELKAKKIFYIAVIDGRWTKSSINLLKNYCILIKKDEIYKLPDFLHEFYGFQ